MKKILLSLITVTCMFSFALSSEAFAMGKNKPIDTSNFEGADDTKKKSSHPAPDTRDLHLEGLVDTDEEAHSG